MLNHVFSFFQKCRLLFVLLLVDILFFSITSPVGGSSLILIVGTVLLAFTIYIALRTIMSFLSVFLSVSVLTQKRIAMLTTLLLVFLILMQSIGQLSIRDVLAAIPLMVVFYLYMTYISSRKVEKDSR